MARWAVLGSAGLLIQDKFHGLELGNWQVVAWVLLILSLVIVLATTEALTRRRPTVHFGRHDGRPAVWIDPALQPLFSGRRTTRQREVEIGRRAVEVGGRVLQAAGRAQREMAQVGYDDPNYHPAYQAALSQLKSEVGAAWYDVLLDLERSGAWPNATAYAISVNFTALDSDAMKAQAIGYQLMRKHGIDPEGAA